MKLFAAALSGAWAFASAASACSMVDWNVYADFAARRRPADFDRAAFVEWVRFEEPAAPTCPRWTDDDAPVASEDDICDGPAEIDARGVLLTASVIEHLKGVGPDRYVLAHRLSRSVFTPQIDGTWKTVLDLRATSVWQHGGIALREKVAADSRHRGDAFWDRGELGPRGASLGACGSDLTLDPRLPHLLFRDADGGVIAAEPVLHADDELLVQARLAAVGKDTIQPRHDVADFFRSAGNLVLVQVRRCWNGRGYEHEGATVRVLRGDPSGFRDPYSENEKPNFDFLADWAESRGQACAHGQALVASGVFGDGSTVSPDRAWAAAAAPELDDETLDRWTSTPWRPYANDFARPVAVTGGRFRRSELITDITLTGPEEITVDQAFAWFEEGRRARAEAQAQQPPISGDQPQRKGPRR